MLATLNVDYSQRPDDEIRSCGVDHAVADADCSAEYLVRVFETSGHVHAVTHHCITESLARTDVADQHVRAMQSDPDAELWSTFRRPSLVDLFHPARRSQRTGARTQHMVGARYRCAPKSHDPVADELVKRTMLLRDRARDLLEIDRHLTEQLVWRQPFRMRREVFQIGKENSQEPLLDAQGQRRSGLDQPPYNVERHKRRE